MYKTGDERWISEADYNRLTGEYLPGQDDLRLLHPITQESALEPMLPPPSSHSGDIRSGGVVIDDTVIMLLNNLSRVVPRTENFSGALDKFMGAYKNASPTTKKTLKDFFRRGERESLSDLYNRITIIVQSYDVAPENNLDALVLSGDLVSSSKYN